MEFTVLFLVLTVAMLAAWRVPAHGHWRCSARHSHIAVWLVIALTALNVVATFMECGFDRYPSVNIGH
jgi:hypothetical protein